MTNRHSKFHRVQCWALLILALVAVYLLIVRMALGQSVTPTCAAPEIDPGTHRIVNSCPAICPYGYKFDRNRPFEQSCVLQAIVPATVEHPNGGTMVTCPSEFRLWLAPAGYSCHYDRTLRGKSYSWTPAGGSMVPVVPPPPSIPIETRKP